MMSTKTYKEGVIMSNYETQYEEYKQTLLQNHWLIKTLREKYRGSITDEGDYIDKNGVLWKIGALGAVCGFCIAFTPIENGNWILGAVLFIAIMGSVIWARHIEAKFKKDSGEINFYAFRYHKHFNDHIQKEKDDEAEKLMRSMWEYSNSLMQRSDCISDMTKEELESLVFRHIKKMGDFQKRYEELDRYDRFIRDLKSDYYFNAEVQKDIDKYI